MTGRTILIIDDDEVLVDVLVAYLSQSIEGALVVGLSNTDEAIHFLQTTPVDILISDLWMPGTTGDQLLGLARMTQPQARRILMTASPDAEALMEATNKGGLEYCFHKPIEPKELSNVVEAMLTTM